MKELDFDNISLEEGQELKLQLGRMLESEGWKFFERFLQVRMKARHDALVRCQVQSIEHLAVFNKLQGGIEELAMVVPMMQQVLNDITENVRAEQDRMAEEEEQGDE